MTATLLVDVGALDRPELTVEGEDHRHLFRSRRLQVGDLLRLTDGCGRERIAEVVEVDRRSARVLGGAVVEVPPPPCELRLWVGTPKPERAAWLVEKTTELGVAAVHFVSTARTVRSLSGAQESRLGRVARSALQQSGGAHLPVVTAGDPWQDALAGRTTGSPGVLYVLDGSAGETLVGCLGTAPPAVVDVLIGPEGGLAEEELEAASALGGLVVGLGPRILRVETAAVAAASLVLARC